jgi:O-antigen/teichoic acid export membrane protein
LRRWVSPRHTRLAAESSQVLLGQALAMVGSLMLLRALSQQLPPAAYGVLALGLTGSLLVSQAICGGSTAAIGRYYSPAREAQALWPYGQASLQLLLRDQRRIVALASALALLLALTGQWRWVLLAVAAGLSSMSASWLMALVALLSAARARLVASALAALDPWFKLLLLTLCWRWWPASPAQTLLLYGLGSAVLTVAAAFWLRSRLHLGWDMMRSAPADADPTWSSAMEAYARPFTRFGLATWLQQASDRWALQAWSGAGAVGQYAVLYQLGYSPMGLLSNLLNTLVAPILYSRAGDASSQQRNQAVHWLVRRLTLLGLLFTVVAVLLSWALHRWLFGLLLAPAYQSLSGWLPWMVLAGALVSVGQLIALKFMSDNRTAELGRIKIWTALLGVVCNGLGAASFGVVGVIVAQNLFAVVYLVWMIGLGLQAAPRKDSIDA